MDETRAKDQDELGRHHFWMFCVAKSGEAILTADDYAWTQHASNRDVFRFLCRASAKKLLFRTMTETKSQNKW